MPKENLAEISYKTNYYGQIPEGWIVKKFNNIIVEGKLGGNYENSENNEGIPVIKMGNLDRGLIKIDKVQNLPENEKYNSDDILKNGDLLFNTRNTLELVGKVAIWRNELPFAIFNSNLMRMKFDEKFVASNYFMNYVFNSYSVLSQLRGIATGTTSVAAIYGKDLDSIKFLLPPLVEQLEITKLLDIYDKAIKTTNTLIEQKQNRKKWLMQMLLTGKKRLKGFEKEKWKEVRLGDVFERVTKKNTEGNQTVVTISAQRGFVMQNDYFNKIIASELLDNYFLVERGEFCYNKSYSNGYPMGATKRLNDFEKAVVTTLYICFKIKDYNKSSGEFFEHLFDANALDKGLMTIANEGGRAHGLLNVTTTDFFNIRINIPGFNEQQEISKILSVSNKEILLLQNKLDQIKKQKKGLMQILLTGKKRLKVN